MYTCIHVYMYICVYVYMYICKYVYMYICIYVYIQVLYTSFRIYVKGVHIKAWVWMPLVRSFWAQTLFRYFFIETNW